MWILRTNVKLVSKSDFLLRYSWAIGIGFIVKDARRLGFKECFFMLWSRDLPGRPFTPLFNAFSNLCYCFTSFNLYVGEFFWSWILKDVPLEQIRYLVTEASFFVVYDKNKVILCWLAWLACWLAWLACWLAWLAGSHIIHTLFVSESMQTLFLFNMHRKGKWKNIPKVDLKWISSFLLPQYNLVCQKIMFTLSAMSLEMWLPLVALRPV